MAPQQPVLMVDFSVYKPPEELKINYIEAKKASRAWEVRIVCDKRVRPGATSTWDGPTVHPHVEALPSTLMLTHTFKNVYYSI